MNKIYTLLAVLLLLGACYAHKKNMSQDVAATPESDTAIEQTISNEDAPVVDSKNISEPIKTQTSAKTDSPAQTTQQSQETTTATAAVEPSPLTPATNPAPFTPTFKDEPTIPTTDRRLHPYADLVPSATAKQTSPWAYEQLKYGLYYGFVKAGTAYIHNRGLVEINGHPAYLLQTTAFSAAVINTVFKVRDINQSWLDATEFFSYGYDQSVREGNYKRDEWVTFDYPAKKFFGQVRKKVDQYDIGGPLDMHVVDMLSALYYVRAHELNVGEDVVFDIINREKQYPLIVKVLKKEKVKVAAGKFDCVLVEPQFRGEGIFVAKGKSLKVWLTDDEYKMPVKMAVEVFIGSVTGELLEYQRQAPENIL